MNNDSNYCDWCGGYGCSPTCPGPPDHLLEINPETGNPRYQDEWVTYAPYENDEGLTGAYQI